VRKGPRPLYRVLLAHRSGQFEKLTWWTSPGARVSDPPSVKQDAIDRADLLDSPQDRRRALVIV